MIKKVKIDQLKPGMYVHDLNCGWMHHPFLKNSMKLKDDKTIEKIASYGIREVYIDTELGTDVAYALTEDEVNEEIQAEMKRVAETETDAGHRAPLREEMKKAVKIKKEAKKTIQNIMDDVRFGKHLRVEKVEHVVEEMVDSIFRNQDALMTLGRIRKVDEYTYMHSMTVCILMITFGRYLGCDKQTLKDIGVGAMMHDVGKMKISQHILTKKALLLEEEYNQMKKHVEHGRAIMKETSGISERSILLVSQHHERMDGSGYPHGLRGDEIDQFGRAVAIVDVYDAMTSRRCYQKKYEPTEVLKKLYEWSKYHYDKELVQHFIRCVGIYPIGSLVRLESGVLGVVICHGNKSLLHPVVRIVYDIKRDKLMMPYNVNLSNGGGDSIACSESSEKWSLEPEIYL